MVERVTIVGAGMAGMFCALALQQHDFQIRLLERDPPPPDQPEDWFGIGERRGVGQTRHTHAFRARFCQLLRSRYPDIYSALLQAGAAEVPIVETIPPKSRRNFAPRDDDALLTVLASRRSTVEWVMRRRLQELPGISILNGAKAEGLQIERSPTGAAIVRGVNVGGEVLSADVVVDASGHASRLDQWLAAADLRTSVSVEESELMYFSRFYRLRPQARPPGSGPWSRVGDLGYMKYGVVDADNGCFSITLAVPEFDETLRLAVRQTATFDAVCNLLPGVAPWVAPERSEPMGSVAGMGNLRSVWREMAPDGRPVVLNLFAVGDSLVRSNPLYGRGCTFAAIEAHLLADVLAATREPHARAVTYDREVKQQLQPYFLDMRRLDRLAAARARQVAAPPSRERWRARVIRSWWRDGVEIALRRDPRVLRRFLRAHHMLAAPRWWLGPEALLSILYTWLRGRSRNADYYEASQGPSRQDLLSRIGGDPALPTLHMQ